jgi:hypothetical protein
MASDLSDALDVADAVRMAAAGMLADALEAVLAASGPSRLARGLHRACEDLGLDLPGVEEEGAWPISAGGGGRTAAYQAHVAARRAADMLADAAERLAWARAPAPLRERLEGLSDRMRSLSRVAWRISWIGI